MDNNYFKISDIPSSLITFLIESQGIEPRSKKDKEETTNNVSIKSNNDFTYVISDAQLVAILNELGPIYCSNYDLWLKATTALKKLNKFDIWMDWCIIDIGRCRRERKRGRVVGGGVTQINTGVRRGMCR